MKLLNAFSISMLPAFALFRGQGVKFTPIPVSEARSYFRAKGLESRIGHAEAAALAAALLEVPVEMNRISTQLEPGEAAVVMQYMGPRLPEGATKLPEGAEVKFFVVEVG